MGDEIVKKWQKASTARKAAELWQDLPNGQKYMNDTFSISKSHCKAPTLVRVGQKVVGGTNYWETGAEFNDAILTYLVDNWNAIYPDVVNIMAERERKALVDCQEYVTKMQELINSSGNS